MMERPFGVLAVLAALTVLGYFVFPGHTYLHQDSQIYLPMMERLSDPQVLGRDLIATHPHLSFTAYDEIARVLRGLTGLGYEPVLTAQQWVMRFLGLVGVFLLAGAAGLSPGARIFAAGLYGLGATIVGPSVLTVEYEPTPRAMALPLSLLSAGLACTGRWNLAGLALFAGLLYHPPTVVPVAGLLAIAAFWPKGHPDRRLLLYWIAAAGAALAILAKLQSGVRLEQHFFATVSPELERLQRLRAAYVFVSVWFPGLAANFLFLAAVSYAAVRRLGPACTGLQRALLLGLPIGGLASVAFSYLSMEHLHWSLIPQMQPARAVLWTTFAAILACTMAAAAARTLWERALWLLVPFAVIVQIRPLDLLWPQTPLLAQRLALVVALSAGSAWALKARAWAPALAMVAATFAIPMLGKVKNYPVIHSAELDQLAAWAAAETPPDALFHFPDAGKALDPGIFRARARRAIWVDWKSGGQVNFMEPLAMEWWSRWSALPAGKGDYLVRKPGTCTTPVFENAKYCVEKP